MPAVNFNISWPDGENSNYYSPSTAIHEYLKSQECYTQQEFSRRIFLALEKASDRVYEKYGYRCSAAADEASKIARKLRQLSDKNITGDITVIDMKD